MIQPVTDDEVCKIMVDGGEKLCDYAITQWVGNKYQMDEATRSESVQRWNEVRRRIRPLMKELLKCKTLS